MTNVYYINSSPPPPPLHATHSLPPPSGAGVEMRADGIALQSIFLWIRGATVHKVTVAQRAPGRLPIMKMCRGLWEAWGGGVQDRIVKKGRQQRDTNDKGFSAIRCGLKRRRSFHRPEGGAHSSTSVTVADEDRVRGGAIR